LNYVVDKHKDPESDGGLLHAYQLTSKFDSFQKLGKQSGFLFYIPAWNTSKIDPVTGFVNLFDTRYVNIEKAKAFFCKFDIIRYNQDKGWFEFGFDYKNFTSKADESRTKWTLCTFGTRIETFRNKEKNSQWDNRNVDLTKAFKELFSKYNIDLTSNIKEAICIQTEKDFFESLLHLLKLTLQMRNSVTGTEIDYIISPVANENGEFFDSRTCSEKLPKDDDANGAYNIARKGLVLIEQIKKANDLKKLKFDISNKSWLQYVQNN
jgi:CRISPR-associated protein Cpf1